MRLLFIVDGRSPIALNWIAHFLESDFEVHLVSTYPCTADRRLASLNVIPVAFSGLLPDPSEGKGVQQRSKGTTARHMRIRPAGVRLQILIRQWLGPLTLSSAVRKLRPLLRRVQPDLIHAMRIPYEGMTAILADPPVPLLVSVWGNDFTLHAPATPLLRRYTRLTLQRADALHTDCHRDVRLAHAWGFSTDKPVCVLPGAGGVQLDLFHPPEVDTIDPLRDQTVINPRGFRAYVRNDTFFRAIPLVLAQQPQVRFLCPAMAEEPQAHHWVKKLGIANSVELLPRQGRSQMAELFRRARLAVSPTMHDGTPNTLLEAMACGCVPLAGDLESLREWITPGVNGLLFDPCSPQDLAHAILRALKDTELCQRAQARNTQIITERADYQKVMREAEGFYRHIVG